MPLFCNTKNQVDTVFSNCQGAISTVDEQKTLYECVKDKKPYAIEYLNIEQCRTYLPGIESFLNKAIKTLDLENFAKYLLFIKGFYKVCAHFVFQKLPLRSAKSPYKLNDLLTNMLKYRHGWGVQVGATVLPKFIYKNPTKTLTQKG